MAISTVLLLPLIAIAGCAPVGPPDGGSSSTDAGDHLDAGTPPPPDAGPDGGSERLDAGLQDSGFPLCECPTTAYQGATCFENGVKVRDISESWSDWSGSMAEPVATSCSNPNEVVLTGADGFATVSIPAPAGFVGIEFPACGSDVYLTLYIGSRGKYVELTSLGGELLFQGGPAWGRMSHRYRPDRSGCGVPLCPSSCACTLFYYRDEVVFLADEELVLDDGESSVVSIDGRPFLAVSFGAHSAEMLGYSDENECVCGGEYGCDTNSNAYLLALDEPVDPDGDDAGVNDAGVGGG